MTIREYEFGQKAAHFILVRDGKTIPNLLLYPTQHWWKNSIMYMSYDDETSFSIQEILRIISS